MQNTNNVAGSVNEIVKTMYDSRLILRDIYLKSSIFDISNLRDDVEKCIKRILKDEYTDINIDILSFEINIVLKLESNLSDKKKNNLIKSIHDIIRLYVQNHAPNSDILFYLSNEYNPIFDIYTVSNSVKLIL